ncbi:Protein of unknown function [Nannocystis exedens]|uniref:DUF3089 domain-containing protein n=1 Tax=Nannocystis exedens TaxID=54 RepID=A0A1I2G7S4_9BACT|nr:DUF3089 domain-containing protein [Nannocystis exedens]PCC67290.1 hypothetical protein NAEX_00293 [Nannocystis exedens]SFF12661.1 Protein of unknown function [Nannocystis exedens]
MIRRGRWILLSVAALLPVGLVIGWVYLGDIVLAMAAPGVPFDPADTPPPPDYGQPASWSARPETADAADAEVEGVAIAADPAVDVFYLHPTSFLGAAWNARVDDATVNEATDAGSTRIQASAFNGCCRVFAPRYRQANMTAFTTASADGAAAIGLAGDDAIAAFRHYLEHDNHGRPFILAAHSQGAFVGLRLLREVIAPGPLRGQLVAAYLIGGPITHEALGDLPVCASAEQTGCVVAFNARGPDYVGGIEFVENPPPPPDAPPHRRVCVNPLTWRADEAPARGGLGAVFWDSSGAKPRPRPEFVGARCEAGTLRVELSGTVPRDFMSRLLDHALGAGNYHAIEYGLFWLDLRANAAARAKAFLASQG